MERDTYMVTHGIAAVLSSVDMENCLVLLLDVCLPGSPSLAFIYLPAFYHGMYPNACRHSLSLSVSRPANQLNLTSGPGTHLATPVPIRAPQNHIWNCVSPRLSILQVPCG